MQRKPWGKHNTHTIWFETMKHLQLYSVHLVVVDKAEESAWLIYADGYASMQKHYKKKI